MSDNASDSFGGTLSLRPLTVEDAAVMVTVLADPGLYRFTGGGPPTEGELVRRYSSQVRGVSPDGSDVWINLVVALEAQPIGYVQATIEGGGDIAELAWVIGRRWQHNGYAKWAVRAFARDLVDRGVSCAVAHVHPSNHASQRVAESIGLSATAHMVNGEVRWMGVIG